VFGISFSELFVITIVALLVVGPEKLPKVARTIGALTGRVQRYVGQVKEEVNRELRFEELQKLQQEIKDSVQATQFSVNQQLADIENTVIGQDNEAIDSVEEKNLTQKTAKKAVKKTKKVEL
jgi:sec-independent protein translocase protein TatB